MLKYGHMEENQEDYLNLGEPIMNWEVDEYPNHVRSRTWYIVASIIGAVLIVYAIATANFLFAVLLLMIGVITLVSTFKEPDRVPVVITTTGIVVGDMYYDYQSIRDFSIAYDPPEVSLLYLDFHSSFHPVLSVPLEGRDPNDVRESLLPFVFENLERTDESLTDLFKRLYKL